MTPALVCVSDVSRLPKLVTYVACLRRFAMLLKVCSVLAKTLCVRPRTILTAITRTLMSPSPLPSHSWLWGPRLMRISAPPCRPSLRTFRTTCWTFLYGRRFSHADGFSTLTFCAPRVRLWFGLCVAWRAVTAFLGNVLVCWWIIWLSVSPWQKAAVQVHYYTVHVAKFVPSFLPLVHAFISAGSRVKRTPVICRHGFSAALCAMLLLLRL